MFPRSETNSRPPLIDTQNTAVDHGRITGIDEEKIAADSGKKLKRYLGA